MGLPPDTLYLLVLKWFLFIGFVLALAQLLVAKLVSFWHEIRRLIGLPDSRGRVTNQGRRARGRGAQALLRVALAALAAIALLGAVFGLGVV